MKLDVDNFAHRWTFLANFFLNTSTPRDLSIARVFNGARGRFLGIPFFMFFKKLIRLTNFLKKMFRSEEHTAELQAR